MTDAKREKVSKGRSYVTGASIKFKYYIHDTAAGYTFEMLGPLTETEVGELSCCWQTAKTTLKDRTFMLDLRGVTSVDDAAKRWLAVINQEGAKCLPDSFLFDALAGQPGRDVLEAPKRTWFGRLSSALRSVA